MTRPPCYGCADRSPVCHAQCAAYRDWAAAHAAEKANIARQKNAMREADSFMARQGERTRSDNIRKNGKKRRRQ